MPDHDRPATDVPLWAPSPEQVARANLTAFAGRARAAGATGSDYGSLYAWSIQAPERFWPEVWRFCGIIADERSGGDPWDEVLIGRDRVAPPDPELGPRWFSGARLSFAENLLRFDDDREALVQWNERGRQRSLTYRELHDAVAALAHALRVDGVTVGDRVAGFMPNIVETVIAMLATTSLGAIWSSCSPDFGVAGVLDRFGQIRPRVLIAADGYRYNGKEIDCMPAVRAVKDAIPSIERIVLIPYLKEHASLEALGSAVRFDEFGVAGAELSFAQLPFEQPLFILYSSGTTGVPKCIVHSAGGALLQQLKEHVLHTDM